MRDYRDDVIETLAACEALLRERVASLEADIAIYRTITYAAVARCAELARELAMVDRRQRVYGRLTEPRRQEAA